MSDRVIIFDTTLRDGEQSPGATMDLSEKIRIARQLEMLGVDVIEAGCPAASEGDFEAVKAIAQRVGEEAVESVVEAVDGNRRRFTYEASDLLYHLFVLCEQMGVSLEDLEQELERRHRP